uniref:Transmembrane protein 44 n=1 Tax=Latimeria chalumnae TaxID=7897 RepID=H3AZF6_LATCH
MNTTDRNVPVDSMRSIWSWEYLIECFTNETVCISFGLWVFSALFWISAHIFFLLLRCRKRPGREETVFCAVYCFLGNMCNTVGALLAQQLMIQVFTGAYMAAMEVLRFVLILFPVCGGRSKKSKMRGFSTKHKRDQHRRNLFTLCLPLAVGTGYYIWATPTLSMSKKLHGAQRRLLSTFLQDSTEILGYALGIGTVIITWTSKFPVISRAYSGKTVPVLQVWAHTFTVVANVLYAAAVTGHDRQPEYILRALPWLLNSLGSAALDISALLLSCVMKSKFTRHVGLETDVVETSDTEALLTWRVHEQENSSLFCSNSTWMPLKTVPDRCLHKVAKIGRYMDMSIEQVQQIGFSAMRSPGDGQTSTAKIYLKDAPEPPAYPPVQVIHAKVSSTSSSDAASVNSDLEKWYW